LYQHEPHKAHRSGWLRAAVMGANDGIVSTASLIIGVASAGSSLEVILLAGFAGLVAGAMSMAAELTGIYMQRGLSPELARQVAVELTAHDALGAHARDELGISEAFSARPVQAALSSAASFAAGAVLPLLIAWLVPTDSMVWTVAASTAVFLALLGAVAARTGGADMGKGAWRVLFWGVLAMAATWGVGSLFGVGVA